MKEQLREKAGRLPLLPGVYIMKDSDQTVIYVGKAKQLKNRVSSYFRGTHDIKTQTLVSRISDFDVIVASDEFEALVLENSLIKRHKPRYNILLRDDKGYPFIRLDIKSPYPEFTVVNRIENDGARYFGPFGGRNVTFEILDTVRKALLLPTCGKKFPRDIGRERPCLNYHMGSCGGACLPGASAEEYRQSISQAEMILEGRIEELSARLTHEMEQAAQELKFELAAGLRDRLKAVLNLKTKQRTVSAAFADTDAVGFYRGAKCCFAVLHYSAGFLSGKDCELMEEPLETDSEVVSSLVRQYYTRKGSWPRIILLPCEIDDRDALEQLLTEISGRRVYIETPQRGEKLKYVQAAGINAREESFRATTTRQRRLKTLEWLQKTLELDSPPERIEAFDVSNTGSFGVVAAMTVFHQGGPLKKDYKKFRIKNVSGQDDYHSMREAVERRYRRYLDGDKGFDRLADLLLIDGGATHASAARGVLQRLGISLPVFGMVKDEKHKTRALISPQGQEIGLVGNPAAFSFIGRIQEETHRFAIAYHRSLRSASIKSSLDDIKGVGRVRREQLLKGFKTIKAIRNASLEELSAVVPRNTAQAVFDHFHQKDKSSDEERGGQ